MTVPDHQPWSLRGDHPVPSPAEAAGVEYHRVYAGERRRILRGVLAIVLLVAGFVGFAVLFQHLSEVVDDALFGRSGPSTPLRQAAGALALAALIPYCMLVQRALYGVPAGSLHSVAGRFRFAVLGRASLVFGPLVLVVVSIGALGGGGETIAWTTADLVWYFVIGMVLIPLGAAGEEYGFRGLMFRVLGGWTRGARSGAILGIVVTTVLFSLVHGTLDPFLFTSYLVLFSSMAIVTWRTGGLEVAVVLHAVYNSPFVLAAALHVDVGAQLANRSEAVGSWASLVPSATLVVITATIWWMTRRHGPTCTPENGRPTRGARAGEPPEQTLAGPRTHDR